MNTQDHHPARALSPAAIRQRRCRERRREGAVFIQMELGSSAVQVLARIGFLAACDLKKPQAVANAFSQFVSNTLQQAFDRSRVTG